MTDFYVPLKVSSDDLFEALFQDLTRDELIQIVRHLDFRVAEVDFTQQLVEHLLTSLKNDIFNKSSLETVSAFLSDLANLKYE